MATIMWYFSFIPVASIHAASVAFLMPVILIDAPLRQFALHHLLQSRLTPPKGSSSFSIQSRMNAVYLSLATPSVVLFRLENLTSSSSFKRPSDKRSHKTNLDLNSFALSYSRSKQKRPFDHQSIRTGLPRRRIPLRRCYKP